MHKCPGQKQRFEGVFEVECSACGETLEFFGDDEKQKCHKCGVVGVNPLQRNAK